MQKSFHRKLFLHIEKKMEKRKSLFLSLSLSYIRRWPIKVAQSSAFHYIFCLLDFLASLISLLGLSTLFWDFLGAFQGKKGQLPPYLRARTLYIYEWRPTLFMGSESSLLVFFVQTDNSNFVATSARDWPVICQPQPHFTCVGGRNFPPSDWLWTSAKIFLPPDRGKRFNSIESKR